MNVLKIHLFFFYSALASQSGFSAVFLKTYTGASYDEIGTLIMVAAAAAAIMKATICSTADRNNSYKSFLASSLVITVICSMFNALIPFYPNLLFDEPHPRLLWWLAATFSLIVACFWSLIITLNDVFVINKCLASNGNEHYGQYRFVGSLGWITCSLGMAVIEQNTQLPYLALPYLVALTMYALDLFIFTTFVPNIKRRDSVGMIVAISNEFLDSKSSAPLSRLSLSNGASLKIGSTIQSYPDESSHKFATVEPTRLRKSIKAHQVGDLNSDLQASGSDAGSRNLRVSGQTQWNLLRRLNRHDHWNLVKYLMLFIATGAVQQVHYVFYLQFMTEVLMQRNQSSLLFTLNAILQGGETVGETLSFLWMARVLIRWLGRDASLALCFLLSGLRFAAFGYLVPYLSIWQLGFLDIISGLVFGVSYTLMTELASCYLSMLDKLLLVDSDEPELPEEAEFLTYLEHLKERHSIESIRFALKATIQSIFAGAFEGFGFALGPLVAGFWLKGRGNSLESLYQDIAWFHLIIFTSVLVLEWVIVRLLFKSGSRADRLNLIQPQ